MTVYLIWIAVALVLLGMYHFFIWRRNRIQTRFRLKLTALFLLFVLIPTVPMTFIVANLVTRGADLLLVPGIGEALNTSLETIKTQAEERGEAFLQAHDDYREWSTELLEEEGVNATGHYRLEGNSLVCLHSICLPTSSRFRRWTPRPETILDVLTTRRISTIVPAGEESKQRMMIVYRVLADSSVTLAAYTIPAYVMDAREEVERAFGIYSTLSLIKESIIQKNLIWALAVLLVVGLALLSIATSRKISQGISEPIQALVGGMRRVADGDLSAQVETKAKDEFRFLVESFNTMTQDLNTSRQKLLKAERLAAWQGVARQISHEIKNSLTPISISLRRFRDHFRDKQLPPSISDSLQAVEEELHSLEAMAKEFSEFARMPRPEKARLDINRVVQSVVHLMKPSCGPVKIAMHLGEELPLIEADREQMKRLLNNIIKNAVEASHNKGTVVVTTRTCDTKGRSVEIEVKDKGEGMDEETLENLFRPYYTTKKRGTGLGLAIVQKIIEDHGGEIFVVSQKGEGTRVRVCL